MGMFFANSSDSSSFGGQSVEIPLNHRGADLGELRDARVGGSRSRRSGGRRRRRSRSRRAATKTGVRPRRRRPPRKIAQLRRHVAVLGEWVESRSSRACCARCRPSPRALPPASLVRIPTACESSCGSESIRRHARRGTAARAMSWSGSASNPQRGDAPSASDRITGMPPSSSTSRRASSKLRKFSSTNAGLPDFIKCDRSSFCTPT